MYNKYKDYDQKAEAIRRMSFLKVPEETRNKYINDDMVYVAIACDNVTEEEKAEINREAGRCIDEFHKIFPNDLVYYVIYQDANQPIGNRLMNLLVAETSIEDWIYNDNRMEKTNQVMAYVFNLDRAEYSEFGHIKIAQNPKKPQELTRVISDGDTFDFITF